MAGLSTFQSGPKGSKRVQNGQPRCFFDHLGPFWAYMDISGSFQLKTNLLPQKDKVGFHGGAFEQKIIFCLKWSKRVQTGPKESQTVKNNYVDHFRPFWATLECWQACLVWPFLFVLLVRFFGHPVLYLIDYDDSSHLANQMNQMHLWIHF